MNKVSVYYPYYDVYTDIDTPKGRYWHSAMQEQKDGSEGGAKTLRDFIDIPDQHYINPDRGGK